MNRVSPPRRLVVGLILVAACLPIVRFLWQAAQRETHGFAAYYTASRIVLERPEALSRAYDDDWFADQISKMGFKDIYDVFEFQPPAAALILVPLAGFEPGTSRGLWTAMNVLLLCGGLFLLVRGLRVPAVHLLWILPLSFAFAPLTDNFRYGQGYVLLFFLESVLIWGLLSDRCNIAGAGLGLMGILKTAGLWIWPFLVLARQWRPLKSALGAMLLIGLLSASWLGLAPWGAYFDRLPELAYVPKRYVTAYQTVASLTGHLLVFDGRWNRAPVADLPALAPILDLGVVAASFVITLRAISLAEGFERHRAPTLGLITALIVAPAPLAEGYHYTLVLPAVVIASWWAYRAKASLAAWAVLAMAVCLLAAPFPYRSESLAAGWWALLAYPRVYGAYLLWGWFAWRVSRAGRAGERASY